MCYRVEVANSPAALTAVYRLRQSAFQESDVDLISQDILSDVYDTYPNSKSHLLFQGDHPIGTIRTSLYSAQYGWQPLPAMELFESDIKQTFSERAPIAQSSFFAIVKDARGRNPLPKLYLYRGLLQTISTNHIDDILTIIRHRPTQQRFYEKIGFTPVSAPKVHPQVNRWGILMHIRTADFTRWTETQLQLQGVEQATYAFKPRIPSAVETRGE
jgi:hypothetical protein